MAYGTALTRAGAAALGALALAACGSATRSAAPSAAERAADLRGSPAPLAALHRQAGQLLGGGASAFAARLRALRGYPVLVMQWASWCAPCKDDFPYFQQLSAQLGSRVAFIGNDVDESRGAAAQALRALPVSFPSYLDANRTIAAALNPVWAGYQPVTYFYSRSGAQRIYAGPFLSEHNLRQAIRRNLGV